MTSLDSLNERQRQAVEATEGPVLVLAGAGTGKTRVITYRVAHLIKKGVPGSAILAVTFTNKAAGVMKERIADLLRSTGDDASGVLVSTFHSFCARLLRREAAHLGLARDFAIYDDDAQTAAVKRALRAANFSAEDYPPGSVRAQISHAKNHGITPETMESEGALMRDANRQDVAKIFRAYDAILRKCSALDFDDLLLQAALLLREHPQVREAWNARFQYILVDEFQDTNAAQEELVRLLGGPRRNICVVGDEDQSIYGWRGASAGNMKRFTDDFPDAQVIRLEENYRSTQTILDAAATVVKNNPGRLGKTLTAMIGAGVALQYLEAQDATAEAEFICAQISIVIRNDPEARVAVLYRTGAQSRSFEEVLRRTNIRYRLVGGFSFYERSEVRSALAYIRLLFHPEDDVALLRVLNVPPRGIGATTVASLEAAARENSRSPAGPLEATACENSQPLTEPAKAAPQDTSRSLWEVICAAEFAAGQRTSGALRGFRTLIEEMTADFKELPPAQLLAGMLDRTGLLASVEQQDNLEYTSRAENLRELANAMTEATEQGQTLDEILDRAALVSDSDDFDETISVSLMTLHSAKGLEFDAVYLAGLEEGLLPHSRSLQSNPQLEEERRLFYVGMTRAKKSLLLSRAIYRRTYGEERLRASLPSRFLAEVPQDLLEAAPGSLSQPGETRRYEADPEFSDGYEVGRKAPASGGYAQPAYTSKYSAPPSARAARKPRGSADPLVGTRVRHPKYGIGTITGVDGEGEDRRLMVSFQDYGPKKLIERYANLRLA